MKNINLTSNFHKCINCQEIDFITLNTSCIKCGNSNNIVEFEDLEKTPYFCEDCNILFGKCECLHMDSGFDCMEDVHYAIIISIWKYKGVIYEGMPSFQNIQECRDLLEEIDENSSILMTTKDKTDQDILDLLNELILDYREQNNLRKIESLEKKLINNLDESSYSELIKLKSQLNRD